MKKFLALTTAAMLTLSAMSVTAMAGDGVKLVVNGVNVDFTGDQEPVIQNGRTLVPFRAAFEKMGAQVNWHDDTRLCEAVYGDTTVSIAIGDTKVNIGDGATIQSDVPAQIINGRTMVPLRILSESIGAEVNWNNTTKTVTVNTPQAAGEAPTSVKYTTETDTITGKISDVTYTHPIVTDIYTAADTLNKNIEEDITEVATSVADENASGKNKLTIDCNMYYNKGGVITIMYTIDGEAVYWQHYAIKSGARLDDEEFAQIAGWDKETEEAQKITSKSTSSSTTTKKTSSKSSNTSKKSNTTKTTVSDEIPAIVKYTTESDSISGKTSKVKYKYPVITDNYTAVKTLNKNIRNDIAQTASSIAKYNTSGMSKITIDYSVKYNNGGVISILYTIDGESVYWANYGVYNGASISDKEFAQITGWDEDFAEVDWYDSVQTTDTGSTTTTTTTTTGTTETSKASYTYTIHDYEVNALGADGDQCISVSVSYPQFEGGDSTVISGINAQIEKSARKDADSFLASYKDDAKKAYDASEYKTIDYSYDVYCDVQIQNGDYAIITYDSVEVVDGVSKGTRTEVLDIDLSTGAVPVG
jgi:hypothetical protein